MKNKLLKILDFTVRVREVGVIIPIILAVIIFSSSDSFLTSENLLNIFRNTSFIFITAIGMTLLIICGGLDLAVGSVYAFAGVMCGLLMTSGIPTALAIIITVVVAGVVFGSINGFFVQKVNLPPFIATMATMNIARGVVTGVQKGVPVYPLPEDFNSIGQGSFFKGTPFEIPFVVIIALVLGVIAIFVLKKTVYGRMIFAVGGNIETARLAGIPTKAISFSAYILVSMLAALSGIMIASRLGSAQPNVGSGYEMSVIAAVVIGGTSLNGGAGSIIGSLLGALFMTTITNGMTLIKISPFWQQLATGIVLLLACSLDQLRNRLKR
jgi:ribose/xylose/arabinose/galactoside ABC-type transport system permease subunit